jgi:hypothetical protein
MIGRSHFRRKKCVVLNLNPVKTKEGDDFSIRFLANGLSYNIQPGEEVDLIEPAYFALKENVRTDHDFKTTVNPDTGDVTHTDKTKEVNQFTVIDKSEWYWPEGHSAKAPNPKIQKDAAEKEALAKMKAAEKIRSEEAAKKAKKTKKKEDAA